MDDLSIEEMMAASADLLQAIEDEGLVDMMPDSPLGEGRKGALMYDGNLTIDDEREVSVSFDSGPLGLGLHNAQPPERGAPSREHPEGSPTRIARMDYPVVLKDLPTRDGRPGQAELHNKEQTKLGNNRELVLPGMSLTKLNYQDLRQLDYKAVLDRIKMESRPIILTFENLQVAGSNKVGAPGFMDEALVVVKLGNLARLQELYEKNNTVNDQLGEPKAWEIPFLSKLARNAAKEGHRAVLHWLLMQGADAKLQADGSKDDRDGGWNCFHQAASGSSSGAVEAMQMLLSKEKELLHARNSKGFTAFDVAADAGSLAAVRWLVEEHNVPSWDSHQTFGCNGFQLACRRGKLQVAEYLLSIENVPGVWMWKTKLERVQCMDSKGKTALHYAGTHTLHTIPIGTPYTLYTTLIPPSTTQRRRASSTPAPGSSPRERSPCRGTTTG
jgi:hypothetical protein